MPTLSLRFYLELAASLIIIAGVTAWTMHERKLGRDQIELADAKATQKAQAASKLQTDALAAQAAKAAQEASHAEALLNAYMVQFPSDVWVCRDPDHRSAVLPHSPAPAARAQAPASRPDARGQVPARSSQPAADISPELRTLVRSFGEMAIDLREFQER